MAGGTVAGAAVAGGGTFTAMATGVFETPKPDPFGGMPRSLALSLPAAPGGDTAPLPPLPDQMSEGTLSKPGARVDIPYADEPVNPKVVEDSVPTALPFEFKTSGYKCVTDLPEALRPWRDRPTSWANVTPNSEHVYLDSKGVVQYRPNKTAAGYDQPVTQIQFGLGCITSYRTEKDAARKALFLKRAKAQADRLIEKRVEARGAWYFPYPFNFTHAAHSGITYKAPWYSGMAQGEAISLFTQLSQLDGLTEQERTLYKAAADGAFASLLRADDAKPWAVNKDKNGYLWIQEYPINAPGTSDYTYNGMIFAMFGIWDYFQATGNPLAEQLYDGSLTTIRDHFPRLRNTRWFSYYCDTHRIPAPTYHQHHINLLRQLHWQTGSPTIANRHDQLIDDFPAYGLRSGSVAAIAAGTHTLYKLDTLGAADSFGWSSSKADKQLATKKVTFSKATQAPVNVRRRIMGRGIYYRINAGAYAGWWIGEAFPKAFLRGEYVSTTYLPQRTATFPANVEVTCVKFGTDGTTGSTKTVKFAKESNAPFDRRAVVNGRPMVRITAGGLNGYWAPTAQVLTDGR
ncbi:D-glucuronyl C5-epimerase family protein [Streptomyces sp. NBC_01750]|uniref:D-glucuronyl C5-epimerase family protein n=1 Tax=Streptomyces sp. NBC_01750 TaxID=2975928 RepID=UPI002DDAEC6E|nr:D-glucuronyl C5-epimerase family protein [Streptomyces sp. NBC_01750]WSD33355.1 D-glucuronyl C5-epimerase family protein [Streptomyces sp. NBC_01750]